MSGSWNIDLGMSVATVKATAAQVEGVAPSITGIDEALTLAAASIPGGVVVTALNDVAVNSLGPNANAAVEKTGTIITSTVQALGSYANGDLAMAASAQASAARAEIPTMLPNRARGPVPQ